MLITYRKISVFSAICVFFLVLSFDCLAQEIKVSNDKFLTEYDFRIKQFSEFISRFNFQTDIKGDKINTEFASRVSRADYVRFLFNLKDPRLNKGSQSFSKEYVDLINHFVSDVVTDSILLNRYSENIIASARTNVLYNNTPREISIYLNQEIVNKTMVKWVVASVSADFLDFMVPDTSMVRFIPPSSNELDFANLKRAMEDKSHLGDYASKSFVYDPLSVFFYNINKGSLIINYVSETNYYIFDIPGWCIKVKDFNRTDSNSGWLIDNINKTDMDPLLYVKSL
jgi:hypothetical protein